MLVTKLSVGARFDMHRWGVAATVSQASGNVPASSTGLSKDSPYADQVIWVNLTNATGSSW